ncbi:HAMP domain-containing sensor histidine kinase [Oricola thermophila]|uniref:histidine kinase n=1 Tax=Oricola thermophila TaxID=2742145 RepID=A0A6N1VC56_9HYPH|nr:ATP-binding protein [Oricola thermophila]QKV18611.1 HAMP domain-containing protein [Oricola thermophila]
MKKLLSAFNTTAARLSALYLVLFTACAVFLVFYMTGSAARLMMAETQKSVSAELRDLDGIYQRNGLRALVLAIDRRSRRPGANLYMIADNTGRILTGNVIALEPGVIDTEGWTERPFAYARFGDDVGVIEDPENAPRALARVIVVDSGMRILVGRDLGEPQRFRELVRRALITALAFMAAGGFLIWFFVGRRALHRIDRVSAASARIVAGDLSGRLPVSGANDEFDRLSESLNSMIEKISKLNDGLRDVSDSIAHDLKTPLTRLRNRAEAALAGNPDDTDYRAVLEDMIVEADQLIKVFNALLLISRVEAGFSKQKLDDIDLAAIAAEVAELYEPLVEDAGMTLVNEVEGPLPIAGKRELIGQAVTNLIDNAIKYGSVPDGRIVLSASRDEAAGKIRLSVADQGPGIPEGDRERVKGRFVRLDESRSKPGSGLGLSLVAAIMGLHGGELSLEDAHPGLKVVLSFPAAKP